MSMMHNIGGQSKVLHTQNCPIRTCKVSVSLRIMKLIIYQTNSVSKVQLIDMEECVQNALI